MEMKKTLKNTLKVKLPFYKIKPGGIATITIDAPDDIHLRGIELGHLIEVKEKKKAISKAPKTPKKKVKKKVKYSYSI